MPTIHIHITGQVQGVGFRPYVYRLARSMNLLGEVSNGMDGVHVFFNAEKPFAGLFYKRLLMEIPERASVLHHKMTTVGHRPFTSFEIVESSGEGKPSLLITPDLGLCSDCRRELHDATDRRYRYPFTTCINCGPRYSIMIRLPYDRERTTMEPFRLCRPCREEYLSPLTRRHFSQTNSCPACAVELQLLTKQQDGAAFRTLSNDPGDCIRHTLAVLAAGKIVAVKGIGGYLLVCDATNPAAVTALRQRKHRPSKPFALMYPDLQTLRADAHVSDAEASAFISIESPIVLCALRSHPASGIDVAGIAPHLGTIGAMQPYTPLFELILSKWGKPIVATSGNLSGSPIFYDDKKAMKNLGHLADAFLVHNRDILLPQDDSVVRFSPACQQRIVLRRSRGYVPTYIHPNFAGWDKTVLAMGADLKSTFALQHAGNTYISQYLGDLESYDTQENYEKTMRHFLSLFDARPRQVVVDRHPGYFSSEKGKALAKAAGITVLEVQHHVAHFAAVLAENELLESREPVLGVIWDGTGWGDDGNIWGGEFFLFESGSFKRVGHLDYFPHLLGDKMAKEPRLPALALCHGLPGAEALLRQHFTEKEWAFYQKLLERPGGLLTSSAGRLFDGVAALLGLQSQSSFEGEAAMRVEALAGKAEVADLPGFKNLEGISLNNIVEALLVGEEKAEIAFNFHLSLTRLVGEMATRHGVRRLAFSGGVFQNALLTDLIIQELGGRYELHFHKELSPNDECISFGQLAYAFLEDKKRGSLVSDTVKVQTTKNRELCV
jgi:hydrogenase maturation protein HypF